MTAPISIRPVESPGTKSPSRRALLAGALGGLGAWAAGTIGRAAQVRAGIDGDVVLGGYNETDAQTTISVSSTTVFAGSSTYDIAPFGTSYSGHGIHGQSSTGWAGYFDGQVLVGTYVQIKGISSLAAPPNNQATVLVRDNGSRMTQLCVRFHTGAPKVLATQP